MLLAIESSCDETGVALVRDGCVMANVVASQVRLHAEYGGVVPELATREHVKNLPLLVQEVLREAGIRPRDLRAIAATRGPGLPAALMAGYMCAQAMAFSLGVPLIGVHHHEAHLYSPWLGGEPVRAQFDRLRPNVSLIVSGGHTLLVHVRGLLDHAVLGGTLDDAAGECFDKVAKLLGLPYPGGPVLDRLAEEGNAARFSFPRPLLHAANDEFSFSGLKTSVRVFLEKNPGLAEDPQALRDVCASVRAAIVETLVTKTLRAARRLGLDCVTASGGVTCNRGLRRELLAACQGAGVELRLADPVFCTDNAAMVGLLGELRWKHGHITEPDSETIPGWDLTTLVA
jgi:N6-L-threonylcarbamoyladenine synthase